MKYVKKRIPIEAYQTKAEMYIETLEGTMHASVGDYIITGVNGERYPCKPDIFEKTYEPCEEDAVSRKMAMDAITASTPCCVVPDDYYISAVDMEFRISTLPSVTPTKIVAKVIIDDTKLKEIVDEAVKRLEEESEPERKTGKWLPENRTMDAFWVCSACGFPSEAHGANILYKFCPNCGADMRGDTYE